MKSCSVAAPFASFNFPGPLIDAIGATILRMTSVRICRNVPSAAHSHAVLLRTRRAVKMPPFIKKVTTALLHGALR